MADLGVDERMPILKKSRLSSGIPDLDIILEGGYHNPGNIIVIGPSAIEKEALAYHFISGAGSKETAYLICGNSSPEDIMSRASTLGINLNKDNIYFIDCYSATLGKPVESTEKVKIVSGPSGLNDLSLTLNEAIKSSAGKRIRVVFDTFSTFVLYNPRDSIRKFLSVVEGRLKSAGATTIYLIDEGVHDRQLLSLLEQGIDEVYTITDKGGKFTFTIPEIEMGIPIKVGPSGLTIS
ncbi:hypothetical protein HZC07_04165 [Candidatus Micrarchaeota archaeon]|nr:hypothetical protein [Candidatus Micrarchaeota archaeon]